jgi:hypothetical protein
MANVQSLPEKWLPVSIAPADTNLEVGVMDKRGDVVALVFPVRKKGTYWVDAGSKKPVDIGPTHLARRTDGVYYDAQDHPGEHRQVQRPAEN